jgi:hypothetical protein
MALGLTGHLAKLGKLGSFDYLIRGDENISTGCVQKCRVIIWRNNALMMFLNCFISYQCLGKDTRWHTNRAVGVYVVQFTTTGTTYQMTTKYTELPYNIPNGRNTSIFLCRTLQNLPKLRILGLKICHLASLHTNAGTLHSMHLPATAARAVT